MMDRRRNHYEMAFEGYLGRLGVPFVAVDEARKVVAGSPQIKLFDYIVYPPQGVNFLVDVKGRKMAMTGKTKTRRWDAWVTRGDLESLKRWEGVFGDGFCAAFVFVYWLAGWRSSPTLTGEMNDDVYTLAGRAYTFQMIGLADYTAGQRRRSPRWDTVSLGSEDFLRVARSPGVVWKVVKA